MGDISSKTPYEILRERQNWPLNWKIAFSQAKIIEWYEAWEGQVYVAFSGGKDSTVLLRLVREIYPEVPAVFANTGLEYPEILRFVRQTSNVKWVKPKMSFRRVIKKYGWPVVSKEVSRQIYEIRNTKSPKLLLKRIVGSGPHKSGRLPKKWHFLLGAPFKIHDRCCYYMKKEPSNRIDREGLRPYLGAMASDSMYRRQWYLRYGCNSFDTKRPISRPLSIWLEEDIWEYIRRYNVPYSPIYDLGYERTGCMFCAFGAHLEKEPNRFQRMKKTHPKQYRYCMEKLGLREVLEFIGVSHE